MTPPDSFAAVIFAVYDVPNHGLHYCSAGHNPPPMVVRRDGAGVERLEAASSVVAGIQPDAVFAEEAVELAPGDKFVLCTDGITEAVNARSELFGEERLRALLAETAERPALVVPDRILQEVQRHAGETPQADDRTIVVMEVLR
jgi:sigma-B regulation protein RsbU (phosphoserine phosphatase)